MSKPKKRNAQTNIFLMAHMSMNMHRKKVCKNRHHLVTAWDTGREFDTLCMYAFRC